MRLSKSVCVRCSKEFLYDMYESSGKFCSLKCVKKPRISTQCYTCKKEFTFAPPPTRKYCSNICAVALDHLTAEQKLQRHRDKFFSQIVKEPNGCWLWQGSKYSNGYGRMFYGNLRMSTHKISWLIHNGTIPKNIQICHTCDIRHCCAPHHLFLGTSSDNHNDMHSKGRGIRGKNHHNAKLTEEKVIEIKKMLQNGLGRGYIALHYNVAPSLISQINTGKIWKHVTLEEKNETQTK